MSGMKPYGFKTKKEGFIFMKKTVKKLAAVGLTLTSVMSLAACNNKTTEGPANGSVAAKKVTQS